MRIGILAYLLHGGQDYRAAGVSRYIEGLLAHLSASLAEDEIVAFVGPDAPRIVGMNRRESPLPTSKAPFRVAVEQFCVPAAARRHALNLVHGTVNVVPVAPTVRSVVTVHDLAFLRHPERFHAAKVAYLRLAVRLSVRKARHVIAVSAATRQDVIEILHVPDDRVTVIYPGVEPDFRPFDPPRALAFRETHLAGRPYILHVGTLEPRKNIDVLIRAFAAARRQAGLPHALVLAGGAGWMYENLFRLVEDLGLSEDVKFAGYVPSASLPDWYNAADLFAYPSAYEGFGLPVAEAMACGTPVITTNVSSLAEIAGDVGLTVEAGSVEALHAGLVQLLEDPGDRSRRAKSGIERSAGFRWETTARQTAAVYRRALEADGG